MTSANAGPEPMSPVAVSNRTNLIVNYLPQSLSQDDMLAIFSSVAPVDSCKLVRDKTTGTGILYSSSFRSGSNKNKAKK